MEFQFVQNDYEQLELKLAVARALTPAELEQVDRVLSLASGGLFETKVTLHDSLERTEVGKLRPFVCRLAEAG